MTDYLVLLFYFAFGVFVHEFCHYFVADYFYKLGPRMDLVQLEVQYSPTKDRRALRMIGLSPIFLGLFVLVGELVYLVAYTQDWGAFIGALWAAPLAAPVWVLSYMRLTTIVFIFGLWIGISAGDLSPSIVEHGGRWEHWERLPRGGKIAIGGILVACVAKYLAYLSTAIAFSYQDRVFVALMADVGEVAAILLVVGGLGYLFMTLKPAQS